MIWLAVTRTGSILSLAAAALQLYDLFVREVKPNRIYATWEAARYLGVSRAEVIGLIGEGRLRAKLVSGNYRIPGQSILEYLAK
ncbi:MAG: helix-turn-helix domain-containing protein [Alphaproteobacteria bacterium]|nr:helix-turn-helix domain-containing protein [Alphaproteobacteria bacterium]MBF0129210.1 helix-turn-helix domain-containing protein [Alphaproteobacteria bacterium]